MNTETVENSAKSSTLTASERDAQAQRSIKNYALATMAVGLVPVPLVDLAGVAALQLKMLHTLAKTYEVPFTKDLGKSAIGSLIGGGLPAATAMPIAASFVKFVPVVGQSLAVLTMPVINGALTYAVGKVFLQHFASGGTLLTFDPKAMRDYFVQQFEEGKKILSTAQQEKSKPA